MKHFDPTEITEVARMSSADPRDRTAEWFVPGLGSRRLRALMGLLFLPYTGMVISFSVIGSVLAHTIFWDRVAAIATIYLLGLGVGAHALDAVGCKDNRPWGTVLARPQLWIVALGSLVAAYLIAGYYIVRFVPLLLVVALIEGFFVFAYNLEWFNGRFHTDGWFVFSWGFLPVLAGYIMQTNRVSLSAVALAASMALFSGIEIKASRPYKELRSRTVSLSPPDALLMARYESILKSVSFGVILLGTALFLWRWANN